MAKPNFTGSVPKMTPQGVVDKLERMSTNYAPAYAQTNFLPMVQLEYEDGTLEIYADPLDHTYLGLYDHITQWAPYEWDGTKHLTTVVHEMYRNTTMIWIVLHYNGIIHPLEIEPGYILKMPMPAQVLDYFRSVKVTPKLKKVIKI